MYILSIRETSGDGLGGRDTIAEFYAENRHH